MEKGDIFDRGNGEYEEYIEPLDKERDRTIVYSREQSPPYRELKILSSSERGSLPGMYRKIGPREKNRLLVVYAKAPIINPEGPLGDG